MWLPVWSYKCLCQKNRHWREGWESVLTGKDCASQWWHMAIGNTHGAITCLLLTHTHPLDNAPIKCSLLSIKGYMECKMPSQIRSTSHKHISVEFQGFTHVQNHCLSWKLQNELKQRESDQYKVSGIFALIVSLKESVFITCWYKLSYLAIVSGLCSNSMSKMKKKTKNNKKDRINHHVSGLLPPSISDTTLAGFLDNFYFCFSEYHLA